jgi:hypothetical protein
MPDDADSDPKKQHHQLELPLNIPPRGPDPLPPVTARPVSRQALRVIRGEGRRRDETLRSRDDVARILVAAAADTLLKRISIERAHEIEIRVERVMRLFERLETEPLARPILRRELDDLERLWREGQEARSPRRR